MRSATIKKGVRSETCWASLETAFAKNNSRGDFHVEHDIYPCQCVRTCVRAFHFPHAMDCCKHNRLDLRYMDCGWAKKEKHQ